MGWGSGSILFSKLIDVMKRNVPDADKRKEVYKEMIDAFRDGDWDTEDECMGEDPAFDEALKEEDKRRYG